MGNLANTCLAAQTFQVEVVATFHQHTQLLWEAVWVHLLDTVVAHMQKTNVQININCKNVNNCDKT